MSLYLGYRSVSEANWAVRNAVSDYLKNTSPDRNSVYKDERFLKFGKDNLVAYIKRAYVKLIGVFHKAMRTYLRENKQEVAQWISIIKRNVELYTAFLVKELTENDVWNSNARLGEEEELYSRIGKCGSLTRFIWQFD